LAFARQIGLTDVTCIPVSALHGDNIIAPGPHTPWHRGPTLLQWLEDVEVDKERSRRLPFRFPVQWVNHPSADFRGFSGTVASGAIRRGDDIRVQPSGKQS